MLKKHKVLVGVPYHDDSSVCRAPTTQKPAENAEVVAAQDAGNTLEVPTAYTKSPLERRTSQNSMDLISERREEPARSKSFFSCPCRVSALSPEPVLNPEPVRPGRFAAVKDKLKFSSKSEKSDIQVVVEPLQLCMYVYVRALPSMFPIDPYVRITSDDPNITTVINQTPYKKNSTDADYKDQLELTYVNLTDTLNLLVMDHDSLNDEVIGKVTCTVADLKHGQENTWGYVKFALDKGGYIFANSFTGEEIQDIVEFEISAKGLPTTDTFGKADPYLRIALLDDKDKCLVVLQSQTIENTLKPDWRTLEVSTVRLGPEAMTSKFVFRVFDENVGTDKFMGESMSTCFNDLVSDKPVTVKLFNSRRADKNQKKRGEITVKEVVRRRAGDEQSSSSGILNSIRWG